MRNPSSLPRRNFLLGTGALLLSGCGGGGGTDNTEQSITRSDSANINFYHLLTTATGAIPRINIGSGMLNRKTVVSDVIYLSGTSRGVVTWNRSEPNVFLYFEQADRKYSLHGGRVILEPGRPKNVCLVGQADSLTGALQADVVVLDRSPVTPSPGSFRVRFLHALVDVGGVGIEVVSEGDPEWPGTPVAPTGQPLFYKQATNYIELPAPLADRTTSIRIHEGTTPSSTVQEIITVSGKGLFTAGGTYFVALAHESSNLESPLTALITKEN